MPQETAPDNQAVRTLLIFFTLSPHFRHFLLDSLNMEIYYRPIARKEVIHVD
jgi:hypothetical protein